MSNPESPTQSRPTYALLALMTDTDLLRTSRDGDQFHYYWAARQCLEMLRPGTDLVAVSIEGVSRFEVADGASLDEGLEVIDIAEYRGSEVLSDATSIVYRQLKHSTVRIDQEITMSELEKTLAGFAVRFHQIRVSHPDDVAKIRFELVTNRAPTSKVLEAIDDVAQASEAPRNPAQVSLLKRYLDLDDVECTLFCRVFQFDDRAPSLLPLIQSFHSDIASVLPGSPVDGPFRLKEVVSMRATSRLEALPEIRIDDVLVALGTDMRSLFPAPPRFEAPPTRIDRAEFAAITEQIIANGENVIVHASGGVGKTVFATSIATYLPPGSQCITYDCFGAGGYRRSSEPRHEFRQGLIQICNELASRGLCNIVLPSHSASAADYSRLFLTRIREAARALEAAAPDGLLVIAVDAADNAVMAAQEFGGAESFVVGILREAVPENVRLVLLCRTERIEYLKPPPDVVCLELHGFTVVESEAHLASKYVGVSASDASEFHDRTAANPRVQALVMSESDTLEQSLLLLGERPLAAAEALDKLIGLSIERIRDKHPTTSVHEIDAICEALASLRPRLPVRVISHLYDIEPATIRSFVADLGRPLLLHSDVLQFRDEPTETWFRNQYKPADSALDSFVDRLRPLADTDPYVAASLPQILWDAGRFDELVALALSSDALPDSNAIERSEIEFQRLRFALNSALRINNKFDATRLALKAGTLSAGQSRRLKLITANTDLAGAYLDGQSIEDIVANRSLRPEWPGANLAYEGALLSAQPPTQTASRNRLRSALSWMQAWTRLPVELRGNHHIKPDDIAESALGVLNTEGPQQCVDYFARWQPADVVFHPGRIVAQRLIDSGRNDELNCLLEASGDLEYLQLAVTAEAAHADVLLNSSGTSVAIATLRHQIEPLEFPSGGYGEPNHAIAAIVGALVSAKRHQLIDDASALNILNLYLPVDAPRGIESRTGNARLITLKGWALQALLQGTELDAFDLAHEDLAKELRGEKPSRTGRHSEFRDNVVPLVPWVQAWAASCCGHSTDLGPLFERLAAPQHWSRDRTPYVYLRDVSRLGAHLLSEHPHPEAIASYTRWLKAARSFLPIDTLVDVVRVCGRAEHMESLFYATAGLAAEKISTSQLSADESTEQFVRLARALRAADEAEAEQYWAKALDTADLIGDDAYSRWRTITTLSASASSAAQSGDSDQRAYRMTQLVEALYPYTGDALDFSDAIRAISRLSEQSAIATAARWRDRHVGHESRIMDGLLNHPDSPLHNVPVAALTLIPLAPTTALLPILSRALRSSALPQQIVDAISDHDRPSQHPPAFFNELDALAKELRLELRHTAWAAEVRNPYTPPPSAAPTGSTLFSAGSEDVDRRRDTSLAEIRTLDLADPAGMERARTLCEQSRRACTTGHLATEILTRPRRTWAAAIATFAANTHFNWYAHRQFVDELLKVTDLTAAARAASEKLVDTAVRRFSTEIATQSWGPSALQPLSALSGHTEGELLDLAYHDLGTRDRHLSSEECFALAGNLAEQLTSEQALQAFDLAVDDLAYLIGDNTADGSWTEMLRPPPDVGKCVAGYLWSALGSPDDKTGWLAAHSVKLMGTFGLDDELAALRDFASSSSVAAFVDQRFTFYAMHARHRLLLAVERVANTHPTHACSFEQLLRTTALGGERHVLFRETARRALLSMNDQGVIDLLESERTDLERLNKPSRKPILLPRYERPNANLDDTDASDVEFHFRMDFSEHWIAPLALCFGANPHDIERRCGDLITNHWTERQNGRVSEDLRHTHGVFADDKTSYYKYERPEVQDLNFYLSVHALMTIAGELIDASDVYQDPYQEVDDFTDWLSDHLPTRTDGRWLADRRDATPPDQHSVTEVAAAEINWEWQVHAGTFVELLTPCGTDLITVWQYAAQTVAGASETTTIHSALVNRDRCRSLLVAMQTANSSFDHGIPAHGDVYRDELGAEEYQLKGWIDDNSHDTKADRSDPLHGKITFPTPQPAGYIRDLLDLTSDADARIWATTATTPAFVSTVWNDKTDQGRGRETGTVGNRLAADPKVLSTILDETAMNLVVKVTIDRYRYDSSGKRLHTDDDDDEHDIQFDRYFKVFILDNHGTCFEL